MTTSYELSLRLKELGVEQNGGQYYFYDVHGDPIRLHHTSLMAAKFDAICRAFTLGELVRELPGEFSVFKQDNFFCAETYIDKESETMEYDFVKYAVQDKSSPEEAAGELYCEILKQKV